MEQGNSGSTSGTFPWLLPTIATPSLHLIQEMTMRPQAFNNISTVTLQHHHQLYLSAKKDLAMAALVPTNLLSTQNRWATFPPPLLPGNLTSTSSLVDLSTSRQNNTSVPTLLKTDIPSGSSFEIAVGNSTLPSASKLARNNQTVVKNPVGRPRKRVVTLENNDGEGFTSKSTENAQRPHGCFLCATKFKKRQHLRNHFMVIHMNAKPFICDKCGHKFGLMANLKTHLKIHNMEHPFKCQKCPSSFQKIALLNTHVTRIHTGSKAKECAGESSGN